MEPSPQLAVGAQVRGAVLGSQMAAVGRCGKPAAVGGSVVATVLGSQARVVAGSAAAGSAGAVVADNNSRAGSHVRRRPCSGNLSGREERRLGEGGGKTSKQKHPAYRS